MSAAQAVLDGVTVGAKSTDRQAEVRRRRGPSGGIRDGCRYPVCFSGTAAQHLQAFLRMSVAPPCRLSAVLCAARYSAAVSENRVVDVERDWLLTQAGVKVVTGDVHLQPIQRIKVE
jgi:hypothetical protein